MAPINYDPKASDGDINYSEVSPTEARKKKKMLIGAIAGGVVVIILLVLLLWWIIDDEKKGGGNKPPPKPPGPAPWSDNPYRLDVASFTDG